MWHVIYFEAPDGTCPVGEFIDSRDERNQAKILAVIEALEERGPTLPRPFADLLEDGIHELRVKLSGGRVRVLYFFCYGDFIVLTNVLIKTTARVPASDIRRAKRCRSDFLARVDEKKLRELVR
ncbi:MAG TPA: type II toxin-antitoxin system RelE/ParE family toxin [Syntrophobacter fumaroxidans]|nr:type II toxin-antitoxin system RelE/ParE family toxin [Syntrophobacter fumaroxidans]